MIDASVALAWHFPGEGTPPLDELLDEVLESGAVVPVHWRAEVANAFATGVRQGRFSSDYRANALEQLGLLEIETDPESDLQLWLGTQELCDLHRLTAYDAAYLELALRRRLPLGTLDRRLASAANDAGATLRLRKP